MIVEEKYSIQQVREVVRCDVCCRRIVRRDMYVVSYNHLVKGTTKIQTKKYQLCEDCAFNRMYDMDNRRERIMTGVTDVEQEELLKGLFSRRKKR